jgi:glycosyltransferase involved in cell wall biosynthesis
MSHDNPTISVIMPLYNSGTYLAEAIESIVAQTYTD